MRPSGSHNPIETLDSVYITIISRCYVVAKCNMQHNALLKVIMHNHKMPLWH